MATGREKGGRCLPSSKGGCVASGPSWLGAIQLPAAREGGVSGGPCRYSGGGHLCQGSSWRPRRWLVPVRGSTSLGRAVTAALGFDSRGLRYRSLSSKEPSSLLLSHSARGWSAARAACLSASISPSRSRRVKTRPRLWPLGSFGRPLRGFLGMHASLPPARISVCRISWIPVAAPHYWHTLIP